MRLTTQTIKGLRASDRRQEIRDDQSRGLYLLLQPSGVKSWAVRYTINGKVLKKTLGTYPEVGLAEARAEAGRVFDCVRTGTDPRDVARIAKAKADASRSNTFGAMTQRFIADCGDLKSVREIEGILRPVITKWRDCPLDGIRRRDVIELIDEVKAARGPYAAGKTLAWVRRAFNWAVGKALIETSPVTQVEPPVRIKARERALSDAEIPAAWNVAEAIGYPFGPFVRLLLLTACRRGEIAGLRWSEIDLDRSTITIPSERYKTGRTLVVPLSRMTRQVIDDLPHFTEGDFVFSTTGGRRPISGFSKMMERFDAALAKHCKGEGVAPFDFDPHDLRRTVRTNMSALRVPPHIAEACLGHVVTGIQKHYDRWTYLDEKGEAFELWAGKVERLINPGSNVERLPRRRATR